MSTLVNLGAFTQPLLIFGGPCSNFQATTAMRQAAEERGILPNHIICTGDLVAYCAEPEKTVNLVRAWGVHVVMGNCEESLGFSSDNCGCGFEEGSVCATLSVDWYNYALDKIDISNRQWMRTLPRRIQFSMNDTQFSVIHGGIDNISEFVFPSSDAAKKYRDIEAMSTHCVIGGHSGIPFGQEIKHRYWLNAGVIGMPANDGQRNGWYMVLTPTENGVDASWHPLAFNNEMAAQSMEAAGLPDAYRHSLISGLWPSLSILPPQEINAQGILLRPQSMSISPH